MGYNKIDKIKLTILNKMSKIHPQIQICIVIHLLTALRKGVSYAK